jgi:hypothetical protein
LKDKRLGVFLDDVEEDSFIIATSEMVYARINKIGSLWCVWYYTKHVQKNYTKIKEALTDINEQFIKEVES